MSLGMQSNCIHRSSVVFRKYKYNCKIINSKQKYFLTSTMKLLSCQSVRLVKGSVVHVIKLESTFGKCVLCVHAIALCCAQLIIIKNKKLYIIKIIYKIVGNCHLLVPIIYLNNSWCYLSTPFGNI